MMATNYGNANAIVPEVLREDNYETWSIFMRNYLFAHDHWDIIESSSGVPDKEDDQYKTWSKKNAWALHAIQISCSPERFCRIKTADSAKSAWDLLAHRYQIEKSWDDLFQAEFEEVNETIPAENESSKRTSRFMPLHKAICEGDLDKVKEFVLYDPEAIREVIDLDVRRTALHVAVTTGQFRIVKLLVEMIQAKEDLEIKDIHGNTALCLAAHKGETQIAKFLISKNSALLSIANDEGKTPLVVAGERGHEGITRFLYRKIRSADNLLAAIGKHGTSLVVSCTMNEMFDMALDYVCRCPTPTAAEEEEYHLLRATLLYQFCRLPYVFRSGCRLGFWQGLLYSCVSHFHQKKRRLSHVISDHDVRIHIYDFEDKMVHNGNCIYQCIRQVLGCRRLNGWRSTLLKIFGIKRICDMKVNHNHVVLILHCICQQILDSTHRQLDKSKIYEVIQEAIKNGITELVVEVIEAFPSLIWFSEEDVRDILISAMQYRQQEVFSLVYELYPWKDALATFTDDKGNNLLHLVAMLAPDLPQVDRINGALQMQSELRWYKAVESIVPPMSKHARNLDDETPRQIFAKTHKILMRKEEEWMKNMANSSTVVGTLIITVTFAAAFTVPGGNHQDSGFPIFLHKAAFLTFVMADALSLFMATTSVLMFFGILTSRFAEEDFLKSLPTKLIFCLSTLFISIAAMMTAFCAAVVIILRGRLSVIIPIVALACIPVGFFALFQIPVLAELITSTYGRRRSFFKI